VPCTATCNNGTTLRKRMVAAAPQRGGTPCDGLFTQFKGCFLEPCARLYADCTFGDWSGWSSCSQRCGGNQERVRNILTYAKGLGKPCEGSSRALRPCDGLPGDGCKLEYLRDCSLSMWSDWSACSRTCGGGQTFGNRQVDAQARGVGRPCGQASLRRVKACSRAGCPGSEPQDCVWEDWGPLTRCSASCGGGQQYRNRKVATFSKFGGRSCQPGDTMQAAACAVQQCFKPTDCVWTPWSAFGQCSAPCGGGQKRRKRQMLNSSLAGLQQKDEQAVGGFLQGVLGDTTGPSSTALSRTTNGSWLQFSALVGAGVLSLGWFAAVVGGRRVAGLPPLSEQGDFRSREAASYMAVSTQDIDGGLSSGLE